MKAVLYARFSPRPDDSDIQSINKQFTYLHKYCELHDYKILGTFRDEAISGRRADNRTGLQQALDIVCKKKAILLVYSLSRLARNTRDMIEITERIDKAGADLISNQEKIDTTSAMGRFVFTVMSAIDQFERERTAERTKDAMLYYQNNQKRRMSCRTPYGWIKDPNDSTMLIGDPSEQATIERIIELYRQDYSYRKICRTLEFEGIAPRKVIKKNEIKDGKWSHPLIKNIIKRAGLPN